ncbi:MAG: NAD-dependent epimerase/dehydratase family protein [Oligoflexia bacterium]|nr:NAD-dependent epimerase/dehydratase family protein [Oligoflexia bacterium]
MHSIISEDIRGIVQRSGSMFEHLAGKQVLLTGCHGMVGSYFLHTLAYINSSLLKAPCRVLAYHRSPINETDSIAYTRHDKNITFIQADLSTGIDLKQQGINYFIHAASPANPQEYLGSPINTLKINVCPLIEMLDYASQASARLLFVSSGQIYGDPPLAAIPTPESYSASSTEDGERACYNEAKRFGELLCRTYARERKVQAMIARPIHLFGPGMKRSDSRVWADFIWRAVRREDIRIASDGRGTRGFCYVADGVEQMWHVLLRGRAGECYNIGNQVETSVLDMAAELCRLAGHGLRCHVEGMARPSGCPERSVPNIGKVLNEFGLAPPRSLSDALERTLRWAQS